MNNVMPSSALLNVYRRYPLVFNYGKGSYLYDQHHHAYLDFTSGIAVNCLGHAHPIMRQAIAEQSAKLFHLSNLYYSEPQLKLAETLVKLSEMQHVFFTNSGTESIELAIKIARKYGRQQHKDKTEIIFMSDSFHGRSTGALAVTGQEKYQQPFAPLMPNTTKCQFNDITDLYKKANNKTCAIIIEPIQGESGVRAATFDFLIAIKQACDQYNALLIFDEIQCGMARMGTLFAYQQTPIIPDIITIAKALGGGIPIGACLIGRKASSIMQPGDHGSTYGGNPLVCHVAHAVVNELRSPELLQHVKTTGNYVKQQLLQLQKQFPVIEEIRGIGLLLGIKLSAQLTASALVDACIRQYLLLVTAGDNVVRYLPPLNVSQQEIDESITKLQIAFSSLA